VVAGVDVKPGSSENTVNLSSGGVLTIAVLGSDELNAADIDAASVRAGGASLRMVGGALDGGLDHANDDAHLDFVFKVETSQIVVADGRLEVTGLTYGGVAFRGSDEVRLVGGDASGSTSGKRPKLRARAGGEAAVARLSVMGAYPNPARDASALRLRAPSAGSVQIEIRALDGRLVAARTADVGAGDVDAPLGDLRSLPAGMYFVTARMGAEVARTKLSVVR
jgi:hypothetical protein